MASSAASATSAASTLATAGRCSGRWAPAVASRGEHARRRAGAQAHAHGGARSGRGRGSCCACRQAAGCLGPHGPRRGASKLVAGASGGRRGGRGPGAARAAARRRQWVRNRNQGVAGPCRLDLHCAALFSFNPLFRSGNHARSGRVPGSTATQLLRRRLAPMNRRSSRPTSKQRQAASASSRQWVRRRRSIALAAAAAARWAVSWPPAPRPPFSAPTCKGSAPRSLRQCPLTSLSPSRSPKPQPPVLTRGRLRRWRGPRDAGAAAAPLPHGGPGGFLPGPASTGSGLRAMLGRFSQLWGLAQSPMPEPCARHPCPPAAPACPSRRARAPPGPARSWSPRSTC
jgi:hypothetical protein